MPHTETCFSTLKYGGLSRGKVFVALLPEIKTFLSTRNEEHEELSDDAWLLDLGFLTDLTAKLNTLKNELQGKDRHLPHMSSTVNGFKAKLGVWNTLKEQEADPLPKPGENVTHNQKQGCF